MTVNTENTQDLFKLIKVAPESQKLNAKPCKHHNVTNVKDDANIWPNPNLGSTTGISIKTTYWRFTAYLIQKYVVNLQIFFPFWILYLNLVTNFRIKVEYYDPNSPWLVSKFFAITLGVGGTTDTTQSTIFTEGTYHLWLHLRKEGQIITW